MAKESFYFSHDHNSRNDPKIQKLMRKHGIGGIGLYWCLIEMLHEQDGYLIISESDDYAFALRSDNELILSVVNDFGLFESDGEKFWSESALRRLEKRKSKSIKASESANKRWDNANALQTKCEGNAIKEIKGKENKEKINKEDAGGFNTMPTLDDVKDLPLDFQNAAREIYCRSNAGSISNEEVLGFWESWKVLNVTGKKYYATIEDVYKHFGYWLKTQKTKDGRAKTGITGSTGMGRTIEFDRP